MLALTVPLYLLEVFDDLVQVSSSDLIEVSGFASLSPKADERVFVNIVRFICGLLNLFLWHECTDRIFVSYDCDGRAIGSGCWGLCSGSGARRF